MIFKLVVTQPALGRVVDQVVGKTEELTKKEAWDIIDEKIRIAEERREAESSDSVKNQGGKKSHIWVDLKVY